MSRGRLSAQSLNFLTSRALTSTAMRIGASLCILCIVYFLCFPYSTAARARSSSGIIQQSPSPATPVGTAQANSGPEVAKNAAKPGEPLVPDPALAPARSLLHEGKLSEAESAIRDLLRAHADSADAHFLLGFTLFREIQAKWLEAGKEDVEALRYNTADSSGPPLAYREAIEAFEQCLKLEPRNVEAENNAGLSYEALQRPDEAIQAFENAIAWQTES